MKHQPPGRLSPRVDPEVVMMICTAGHVDHGKTQLVRLLTGCQTDRLKVEQERGLTIELGFAPCFLGGEKCVGIVDVPGHEKFVKNMVAGVSGIGMTLLVIAADDGIMPQTIEHFQIMQLLGVRRGMVALTKTDLVEPGRVETRIAEIAEFLTGTPMEGAPICPVSSETFEGYENFYNTLVAKIDEFERRPTHGVFRMPVERVFRREGFGCVATGIPVDGTVSLGDRVELVPGGHTGKIRGIERFLRKAESGGAGQCLALNVPDFSKTPPERGHVLCAPGYLRPARFFHLDLRAVPGLDKPLRNAETVKFHSGTIEEVGKIYLLEEKTMAEGQAGFATVDLAHPVAAAVHDRFIIRRASPAATVAGGEILAVTFADRRPRKTLLLPQLRDYRDLFEGIDPAGAEGRDRKVSYSLRWQMPLGSAAKGLSVETLLREDAVEKSLARLVEKGEAVAIEKDFFIHSQVLEARRREIEKRIQAAADAGKLSLNVSDLRGESKWRPALWERILQSVKDQGNVRVQSDRIILRDAEDDMAPEERDLMERILDVYRRTGFQSPRPAELPGKLNADSRRIDKLLRHLYNNERLVRLDKNVVLHFDFYKKAQDLAVRTIRDTGILRPGDFKDLIGSSRKFSIAILEHLDARRITIRLGNDRKLMKGHEKYLS